MQSVMSKDAAKIQLAYAKYVTLSKESLLYIKENLLTSSPGSTFQADGYD